MKLTIEKTEFIAALASARSVAQSKGSIPILGNIALSATDLGLHITATDLDIRVETSAQANVSEPGNTTVNAAKLFDIVKNLSSDREVNIEQKDNYLLVSQGRSRFKLDTLPSTEFPAAMNILNPVPVEFDAQTLHNILSKTIHAVSTEETRYMLGGVYFHCKEGNLNAAATDGYRLAHIVNEFDYDFKDFIIPSRTVNILIKHIDSTIDKVSATIGDNGAMFEIGDVILYTKMIDASFPEYIRAIPLNDSLLKTGKEELLAAINRVIVLADGKVKQIKLKSNDDTLVVTSVGAGQEEAVDTINCDSDNDIEISFNSKYVIDTLNQLQDGVINIEFGERMAPCLFRQKDNETFVVFPVKGR